MDWAVGGVGVEDGRGGVDWVGGLMVGFEAWADDEGGGWGEGGRISDVVEVVVGPDQGGDVGAADVEVGGVGIEVFGDVLMRLDGCGGFDELDGAGGVVFPIAADAQIEEDMLAAMRDQEAEDRRFEGAETFDLRAPENPGVYGKLRSAVVSVVTVSWVPSRGLLSYKTRRFLGLYLSMTRTLTVALDGGMLGGGVGLGSARCSDGVIL